MSGPVRLRIHVSEPLGFERENGVSDLFGTTVDHLDPENGEWLVELENAFSLDGQDYEVALVAPRYSGEHLARVFDSFVGFPIRIAHRLSDDWHFAMTGLLSLAPVEHDNGK